MGEHGVCGTIEYSNTLAVPASEGSMCLAPATELTLPLNTPMDATRFLEGLGGDSAGAGMAMMRVGVNAPIVRSTYKREVEAMVAEIKRRVDAGDSVESIARWASKERNSIISRLRAMTGRSSQVLYTVRDWREYGWGGRSWSNITRRYSVRGVSGDAMHQRIVDGAVKSNATVNEGAMKGARFLKHGGKVVLVAGVALSVARIWNASDEELPRVIGEEVGGLIGGSAGAGVGVGVCLVFGLATGGWGLLACGVVGGVGGGLLGSHIGGEVADGLYYSDASVPQAQISIEIPVDEIYTSIQPRMCFP